jgi:hypothetical protein
MLKYYKYINIIYIYEVRERERLRSVYLVFHINCAKYTRARVSVLYDSIARCAIRV